MKKVLFCALLALGSLNAFAQTDSLVLDQQHRLDNAEKKIETLRQDIASLQRVLSYAESSCKTLTNQVTALQEEDIKLGRMITESSNDLNITIQNNSEEAKQDNLLISNKLYKTTFLGIGIGILLLAISIFIFVYIRKKGTSAYDKIKAAQKAMQEEGLKLDDKLIELLDKQISIQGSMPAPKEPDHSLALKVADEIVRIETNLSRMDSTIRGYKQLSASVRRIKDNFLANGYEMVDMLGKPYKEGMKAIVDFETDESLKEGEQIITSIIKPQINFNGVMIQTAQIKVSQN